MQLGDVSVNYVELMERAVNHEGANPQPILLRYGITPESLLVNKARISIPRFMRLGHALIQEFRLPWLGLLMGRQCKISHMGLVGHAIMTAATLQNAIQLWIHYERLSSENKRGVSQFGHEHRFGIAQFYSISPYNEYNYFVVDCILSSWYHLATWITGRQDLLEEVQIEFAAPSYNREYEKAFRCPIRFNQPRNALIFKPESLSLPSVYAHRASHLEAVALCNRELSALLGAKPYAERVRQLVATRLQEKDTKLERVAQQLGLSAWTLQRRLKKENTSFSKVLDEVREALAKQYLLRTELSISEIGFILGFTNSAAFHRAFNRWHRENPNAFRKKHLAKTQTDV